MRIPRIMLAAPSSGSGKTLITCGILQALVNRGFRVASFKCGPDYIDPMFHSRIIGVKSGNLDTFFTDRETTRYLFGKHAAQAEISIAEGVMGYYDGLGGISEEASSADVAEALEMPVVLVVNCRGMSMSVVPLIKGFLEYHSPSRIQGVILNQMPKALYPGMRDQIEHWLPVKVLGYVPKVEDLVLESRHLGLVMPGEIESLKEKLNRLAEVLEESIDLDALLALSWGAPDFTYERPKLWRLPEGKRIRIAVAEDEAFCFTYRDNLELLQDMGAELVSFSPMKDAGLPEQIDGLILSGGYPELHAKCLSENESMRRAICEAVKEGLPCLAECGGFLYLHRTLEGSDGVDYPMAGVIEARAYRTDRLGRFGYIEMEAKMDQLILKKGERTKGHEFHYWESEDCGASIHVTKPLRKRSWDCVHGTGTLYAGFPHLFFYSNPDMAQNFLMRCEEYRCLS